MAAMQRLVLGLVVLIIVLAMVAGVLVGLMFQVAALDTNTRTANAHGWSGGGSATPDGQLLDASLYVTSYSTSLLSEKIVFAGFASKSFGSLSCLKDYRYRVATSTNGFTWSEVSESPFMFTPPFGFVTGTPLQVVTHQLTGPYVGGVRVQLEYHILDVADPSCTVGLDKGWLWVAEDQAYLESGIGSVTARNQAEIGDSVTITARVGYIRSEKQPDLGWTVTGYSSARNAVVLGPTEVTATVQSFAYTVVVDDFSQASGARNELTWTLSNELWDKDFETTTTIDFAELAPSVRITAIEGSGVVGSPVTVKWDAEPNPTTNLPIAEIIVKWGFSGVEHEDVLAADARQHTFTTGQGGTLHLEVIVYDEGRRPAIAKADVEIRDPRFTGGAEPSFLIVQLIIVAIFLLVGVTMAAFLKGPAAIRVIVAIAMAIIGVVLAYVIPAVV